MADDPSTMDQRDDQESIDAESEALIGILQLERGLSRLTQGPNRGPVGKAVVGVGILGSLLFFGSLALVTLRRGFRRFRWYALSAFWIGMTVGVVLAF